MWRRWSFFRQFKLNLIRLLRLQDSPHRIARGLALGLFLGMTPTFGVQMLLALFAAILLRENKLSAVVGVWVTNPVTAPFIYGLEYETGRILLGLPHPALGMEFNYQFLQKFGWQVITPLCLGSLLFGLASAFIGYGIVIKFIPVMRKWRIKRWPRGRR
ncbi:DUF2062 domain-containing protein [Geopsychrobacter electrodiphilus]|uniref:DUF2062 domain-containing protein n=1 Tax=Geopsychrobacter electrodiphilus TaxID=225196 RepID=UPI00037C16C6|nr:DUF2062 domain-containing protein [Geopsychrobacter electrodiphilus]